MPVAKYRKRPVVIEAIQLSWGTWNDVCSFIGEALNDVPGQSGAAMSDEYSDACGEPGPQYIKLMLMTAHGDPAIFRHGDWIIPDGTPGTFYPCKPDIFAETYAREDTEWPIAP